jgi:hypothetical protein
VADGNSILTAHGDNEYVLKSDLFEAVNGYKKLIKESLWPTKRVPDIIQGKGVFDMKFPQPEPKTEPVSVTAVKVVESLGIHVPKHPKREGFAKKKDGEL